jgi:hypothetical protein
MTNSSLILGKLEYPYVILDGLKIFIDPNSRISYKDEILAIYGDGTIRTFVNKHKEFDWNGYITKDGAKVYYKIISKT